MADAAASLDKRTRFRVGYTRTVVGYVDVDATDPLDARVKAERFHMTDEDTEVCKEILYSKGIKVVP